jgi:vacuolar iron transporter family protein
LDDSCQETKIVPKIKHTEKHFTASETVRDTVIGMSDGLTVPFALAAGLSGAVSSTNIIVTAGLAEIAAGGIAMGLGGYLAAKTDYEHYVSERKRELREIQEIPHAEEKEVAEIFQAYGLDPTQIRIIIDRLREDPNKWVDFMMRFELGLEPPDPSRALRSAMTISLAYIMGGLVPLLPYMLIDNAVFALKISALFTLAALFGFGYIKGKFTGAKAWKSSLQTSLIGGIAATAAFSIAQVFH